ncbi:MAG: ankyrin repeat domain-containing protein [Candidatus Aminicenantes bacterium]|nr:MAG: ankyrin repeat domain-containing protein [Candidatus Aminicenantes bacterium]
MQRKVEKVFKALSKKGMVRAFIETDKKEYVYPLITRNQPKKTLKKIYLVLLGMVFLLAVGITAFNQLVKEKPTGTVSHRSSLDRQDGYGLTPLHHAVIRADMETIKGLIEKGAGIDIQDNYGWTPLHWAVFKQDEMICRFLVQTGAAKNITTSQSWFKFPAGVTALEMAKITKNKALQAILAPGKIENKNF